MAKKISELPSTTTPPSTVEIAVVDSGTTKKTTAADLLGSTFGWFSVDHSIATAQVISGTTKTQLLIDAAASFQGGYANLPTGIVSSDVYEAGALGATSKIKLGWLNEGQSIAIRVSGTFAPAAVSTGVRIHLDFYDKNGAFIFPQEEYAGSVKAASTGSPLDPTYPFSLSEISFISATLADDGYALMSVTFDAAGSHEVQMGGLMISVLN